ncbi:hypothetical protein LCGC14_0689960 [marine sediment metagenome]|uniref:Uncharacterized protein n=1 Tax=marine sediment metagenome TaxID=412755 RepID=A0A0F9QQK6_9ZZZZ
MIEIETEAKIGSENGRHNCYFTDSGLKYFTTIFWGGDKMSNKDRQRG